MRTRLFACLAVLMLGVICSAAERGGAGAADVSAFVGIWSGTWQDSGSGTGGFELTLEKGQADAPAGRVSVTGEPTYKATLKTLAFDGQKMSAAYNFPPDDRLEVALAATFDGNTVKGTWSVHDKAGSEMAAGTWAATKK